MTINSKLILDTAEAVHLEEEQRIAIYESLRQPAMVKYLEHVIESNALGLLNTSLDKFVESGQVNIQLAISVARTQGIAELASELLSVVHEGDKLYGRSTK